MSTELLRVSGLSGGHGRIQALWDVDLSVATHETVVLIGANGAGKTTLIQTVLGLIPLWSGDIRFNGAPITRERTDRRIRAGIAYMSETGCFLDLSVQDNLLLGGQSLPPAQARRQLDQLYDRFPILKQKRRDPGSSLSGGQRNILGVAKALASRPKLLIMDEPSAGLSPLFVKEVIQVLGQFRETGLSLLVAEQNVKFLDLADRVYTLEGGRVGFEGTVAAMHADAALERAYFGLKST